MAEQNTVGEIPLALMDVGAILSSRGQRNPFLERQAEKQAREERASAEATARKRKAQFAVAEAMFESWTDAGKSPEEFAVAMPEMAAVYAEQTGLDVGALQVPPKPIEPIKGQTKFGETVGDIQALEARAVALEKAGRSEEALDAMDAAEQLRQQLDTIAESDKKLERVDLGNRVAWVDPQTGNVVHELAKGARPRSAGDGFREPKIRTVQMPGADGKPVVRQFDVSTRKGAEDLRAAIAAGGIETTRPSGNTRVRRITYDENNRPIIEDTTVGVGFGGERNVGAKTPNIRVQDAAEGVVLQMRELLLKTRPGDVGPRGAIKEQIWNQGIAAFAELAGVDSTELVDTTLVDNRRLARAISERLQRLSQDFPDRFSNQDVARIDRFMLRPGARITYAEWRTNLEGMIQFMEDRVAQISGQLGRKTVLHMDIGELLQATQIPPGQSGHLNKAFVDKILATRFTEEEMDAYMEGLR